jgi:hypothetical protein
MASRAEEKARRREERLAREQAAGIAARRRRRINLVLASVAAIVALGGVAALIATGGGSGSGGSGSPRTTAVKGAPIPARKITNLQAAAAAAGCKLLDFPSQVNNRSHTTSPVKYLSNPPAFGPHYPSPPSDGNYVGQGTPPPEHLVHALEHGRIEIQYRGVPAQAVSQLETLFNESPNYVLLFKNGTSMPYSVAAVAWTHILGCGRFNLRVFDAIRAFRDAYKLKGPEVIAQPE